MNFAHYYNILQQIEKPIFVFDRFENKEIIKLDVDNFGDYLLINEKQDNIRRKLFTIVIEKLQLCHKAQQIENNNFVKFYDINNFHVTYCNIALANEELVRIVELTNKINACDYCELAKIYQNLVLKGTDEFEFGIWDIAQKSNKNCYFNITTTEKNYFTLEIIAVIHKVIA